MYVFYVFFKIQKKLFTSFWVVAHDFSNTVRLSNTLDASRHLAASLSFAKMTKIIISLATAGTGRGVRPSVCPSMGPRAANPLLQVCCCGPSQQEMSIDCCNSGVRRPNAGSATLSAYVGSWRQTCYFTFRTATQFTFTRGAPVQTLIANPESLNSLFFYKI